MSSQPGPANASPEIPAKTQVLVIGGGPAGSYVAAALAREGLEVVLMDMSKFPRYHIGESLLPSVRHYLRFIDAENKVDAHGFTRKPGSAIKFNQYLREGYTDFVALGASNSSWNVVRSEFDDLLLKHAASCGVRVCTETRVDLIDFKRDEDNSYGTDASLTGHGAAQAEGNRAFPGSSTGVGFEPVGRPVKATFTTVTDGKKGQIAFDYLVDASGRAGLLSTKYLKNRRYNESLKNVAVWGYWRKTGMYGAGTARENAPFFEALSDESGWAWFIPLHSGRTSVGVVMDQKQLGVRSRAASSVTAEPLPASSSFPPFSQSGRTSRAANTLADRYLTFLHLAPGVQALLGEAAELEHVEDENGGAPAARSASDFSYAAEGYAGAGWRIIGDAGAFIDPFFSSGVHLAMTGAISAAASVCASVRGDCSEAEAATWHSKRVAISYTRFLVVVLSAYKQIRAQSHNVLVDIDDDNFDKAFAFFRPVIQGGADMGARLSEDEVQRALDFCVNLFNPTTPEQHESVRQKLQESARWPFGFDMGLDERDDDAEVEDSNGTDAGATTEGRERRTRSHSGALSSTDSDQDANATPTSERLLDVRAPIVDPSVLARFLRTRLAFLRRYTSVEGSLPSVATASTGVATGDTGPASAPMSPRPGSTTPTSPVTSTFSGLSSASSRSSLTEGAGGTASRDGATSKEKKTETDDGEESDGDEEIRLVLEKVNARRVIHAEHGEGMNSLEEEAVGGLVVRLVQGQLGLVKVDEQEREKERERAREARRRDREKDMSGF